MLTHTTHQCRDRRKDECSHRSGCSRCKAHTALRSGSRVTAQLLTAQLLTQSSSRRSCSRRSGSRRSGSRRGCSRRGCSQRSSHGTAHGAAAHGAAHGAAAHGAKLTPHSGCSQLRQLGRRQLRRQQFGQRRRLHRLARRQLCAVSALRRERLGQHPLVAPSRNTNRK